MTNIISTIASEALSFLNSSAFLAIVAIVGIVYFGYTFSKANRITNKHRQKVQQTIVDNDINNINNLPKKEYFVACAGSKEKNVCAKVPAIDIQSCTLFGLDGKPLDLSRYNCFVVRGDSMQYAGIKNNDIILVPIDFNIDSLGTFPVILVIEYSDKIVGKPLYKVRRAWHKGCIDDNLEEVAEAIMQSPKFSNLTKQEGYKGEDWMIKDLISTRLDAYKKAYFKDDECPDQYRSIVISTTYDTENKEIHFSIHPISLVVGNVEESYTVQPK